MSYSSDDGNDWFVQRKSEKVKCSSLFLWFNYFPFTFVVFFFVGRECSRFRGDLTLSFPKPTKEILLEWELNLEPLHLLLRLFARVCCKLFK